MNYNKSLSELLFEDHENNELVVERNKNDAAKKRAAKKGAKKARRREQNRKRKALSKDNAPAIQIRGISSAAFLALPEAELQAFASMLFRPTASLKSKLIEYQKNAASLSGQQGGPESTDVGFTQIKNSIAKNADNKLYKSLEKSDNKLNTQVANLIQGTNTTLPNIGPVRFDFLNVGKEDKTKSQDRDIKMFDRLGHAFFTIVDPKTNNKVKIKNSKKEDQNSKDVDQVIVFVLPIKKYLNKFQSDIYLTLFNSQEIKLDNSNKEQGVSNESDSLRFEGEIIHESSLSSLLFETNAASGTGEHSVFDLNFIDSASQESPLESAASDKANSLTNYAQNGQELFNNLQLLDKGKIAVISDGDIKLYYIRNKGFISDSSDASKILMQSAINKNLEIKSNMSIDFINAQSDEDLSKSLTRQHINDGTALDDFNSYYLAKSTTNPLDIRFYSKKGLGYYIKLNSGVLETYNVGEIVDKDVVDKEISLVLVTENQGSDFYGNVDQPLADAIKEIFKNNLDRQSAEAKLKEVTLTPKKQAKSGDQSNQEKVEKIVQSVQDGNIESATQELPSLSSDEVAQLGQSLSDEDLSNVIQNVDDKSRTQVFQNLSLTQDRAREVIKAANLSDAQTQELKSLAKSKEKEVSQEVIKRITQELKSKDPLKATEDFNSLSDEQKKQVTGQFSSEDFGKLLKQVGNENLTQTMQSLDLTQDQASAALKNAGHSDEDIMTAFREAGLEVGEPEEQSGEAPEESSQQDKSKALQGKIRNVDILFNADFFVSNMSAESSDLKSGKPFPVEIPVKIYLEKNSKIFTLETKLFKNQKGIINLEKASVQDGDPEAIKELQKESFVYHQGLSLLIEARELEKNLDKDKFNDYLSHHGFKFISAQIENLEKYTEGSTVFNAAALIDKFDSNKTYEARVDIEQLGLNSEDANKLKGTDKLRVARKGQNLSVTIVDDRGNILPGFENINLEDSSNPLSPESSEKLIQTAEFRSLPVSGEKEKKAPDFNNFEVNMNLIINPFRKVSDKLTYTSLGFEKYKEDLKANKPLDIKILTTIREKVASLIEDEEITNFILEILTDCFANKDGIKKLVNFDSSVKKEIESKIREKFDKEISEIDLIESRSLSHKQVLNEDLVTPVVTVLAVSQIVAFIYSIIYVLLPAFLLYFAILAGINTKLFGIISMSEGLKNLIKGKLEKYKDAKKEKALSLVKEEIIKNRELLDGAKLAIGHYLSQVFQIALEDNYGIELQDLTKLVIPNTNPEQLIEDASEDQRIVSLFTEKFKKSEGTDDIEKLTDRYDVTLDSMMNSIAAMVFQKRTQMAQQEASQIAYQARQDSMDASVLSGLAVMPALVGAAIAMPTLATGGTALLAAPIIASLFGSKMGDRSLRKNLRKGPQQIGLESDVKSGKDQIRKIILDISKDVLGVKEEPKEAEAPEVAAESLIYRQGLSLLIEDIQDELVHNKGLSFLFEEEGDKEEASEDKKESKPETEEDTSHIRASINWATISKKLEAKNFFAYESTFKVGNPNLFARVERELAVKLNALMSDCFGIKITDVEQLSLRASQAEALAGLIVDPNAKQGHGSINGAQPRGNTAKSRGDFLDIDSFTTLLNSMEGDVSKVIMYLLANGKLNSMFDAGGRSGQTVQEVMDVVVKTIKGEMDGMPSSIASDAEEAIRKLESNEWIDKLLKRSQYDSPIKVVHGDTFTRELGLALVEEIEKNLIEFSDGFNKKRVGLNVDSFDLDNHGCIISKSWSGDDGTQKAYFKFSASKENARRAIYEKVVFYNDEELKGKKDDFYIIIGAEEPIFDQIQTNAITYNEEFNEPIASALATAIVIKSMRTNKTTSYHTKVDLPREDRDFGGREYASSVMASIMNQSPELVDINPDDTPVKKDSSKTQNKQAFNIAFRSYIDNVISPMPSGQESEEASESEAQTSSHKRREDLEDLFDAKKIHDDLLRLWQIR